MKSPDIIRIAAAANVSPSTVRRVYAGLGNEYSKERVTAGALSLGLSLPPKGAGQSITELGVAE